MTRDKEIYAWVLQQKDCWNAQKDCFDNLLLLRKRTAQNLNYDPVEIAMASHFAKHEVYSLRKVGKW